MTFNTSDLKDGHLPLIERIDEALRRVKMGQGPMRVPVEATDVDIVLYNCRDRITNLEAQLGAILPENADLNDQARTLAAQLAQLRADHEALALKARLWDAVLDRCRAVVGVDEADVALSRHTPADLHTLSEARDRALAKSWDADAAVSRLVLEAEKVARS